jgi:RimJ/RimL family protein N-acetyltransferase
MASTSKFKIRPLRWNDFDDYCKIWRSLQEELDKDPRLTMGRYKERADWEFLITGFSDLYREIKARSAKSLVLEADGHVVGLCSIRLSGSTHAQHTADLTYYVIKQYRGKGMGTELVKESLKDVPKKCEIITAGTHSNNKASIALLKKFGFKRVAFMPGFSKRGKTYLNVEEYYKKVK